MPTILLLFGWRLFFYANEGNEPIHGDLEKLPSKQFFSKQTENAVSGLLHFQSLA